MGSGVFEILVQMVTLFAIVGVGYGAKRLGVMTKEFDGQLSKVIINIALPAMILGAVLDAEELPSLDDVLLTFGLSCASYAIVIAIAYIVTAAMRISIGHRGVFKFMLCFGNVGFIGFPVLSAIYGKQALIYGAVFNLPFNVLVFTIGILFLLQDNLTEGKRGSEAEPGSEGDIGPEGENDSGNETGSEGKVEGEIIAKTRLDITWRTFLSPAIVACVIAITCTLLGVHAVPVLGSSLDTLGSLTTPAALLIIGSSLANMPVRDLVGGPRLWIASVFRLLASPLCIWAIFHLFVSDPFLLAVIVVISGMPVATNGTMLCYQYGGDSRTMAQGTFVTTVLAIVTIPMLVAFISSVGL